MPGNVNDPFKQWKASIPLGKKGDDDLCTFFWFGHTLCIVFLDDETSWQCKWKEYVNFVGTYLHVTVLFFFHANKST